MENLKIAPKKRIEGLILLSSLPRIAELFPQPVNTVATLSLYCDEDFDGQLCVTGTISASITLACDRCYEAGTFEVQSDLALKIVDNEDAAKRLEGPWEPWYRKQSLYEILEDEILLCLPYEFMHSLEDCAAEQYIVGQFNVTEPVTDEPVQQPFDKLKDICKTS